MGRLGIDDLEDLRPARLRQDGVDELLDAATEATLVFVADEGWPQGVVVSFVRSGSSFWVAAVEGRGHTRGLRRDHRATLVVSSTGTGLEGRRMVSLRCRARVHDDAATRKRILPLLAARVTSGPPHEMLRLLDTPRRVVIELSEPRLAVSHDSRRIAGDGRGGDDAKKPLDGLPSI